MPTSTRPLPSLSLALLLVGCAVPLEEIGTATQLDTSPVPIDAGAYGLDFEVSDGDQRAYLLYLPLGYDNERADPYPLVAMFHGLGGGASLLALQLQEAGLQDLADDQGKIIVFFHGLKDSAVTQLGGWWNLTDVGRDDVLYVEEVLDHLADVLNVDETRVFAGGHSMGGAFVHNLGARIPERFRAIADVAGFYATTGGEPPPPQDDTDLPVMIVHGVDDTIVPPAGGPSSLAALAGITFRSTQYSYNAWYLNNGCTEPSSVLLGQWWTIVLTDCLDTVSDAFIYLVFVGDHGHSWPTADDNYDASADMLAFFDMQ
ncbi:MAG TPA: PHB depolymerase family esterase [Kofleriaceae bacterium]|nr:PHB depolymerase family esterase [Kofleriaceae bacterium]